jgi:ketosteroid isomerase-like protein
MGEHPNVTVVRHMNDAMARGDLEVAASYVADDVIWHEIGRAQPRRGKTELAASMGEADYEITAQAHDILGNDEHVVALVDATGMRGGRTLEYRVAEIYHIRDGKVIERWAFADDTAAITEFFG